MQKALHIADLHLSASEENKDYSLKVLDEILQCAGNNRANFIIFAGDTFDSFTDAVKLKEEFRSRMESLPAECHVLLLAGNHEDIDRKGKLTSYNFGIDTGNIFEKTDVPFYLKTINDIEFLAIPHQKDYSDYIDWKVPPKKTQIRIAIAHGSIPDMTFTGIEDAEENASVIDLNVFKRFEVDYAAMGHIHSAREKQSNGLLVSYPGSARIWRAHETGPRTINLLHIDTRVEIEKINIESAGQYRYRNIFLNFEGRIEDDPGIPASWGSNDYVEATFFGVVENENEAAASINGFRKRVGLRVRKLEFNITTHVLEGISKQSIAKKFLNIWKSYKPENDDLDEHRAWLRSREVGLLEIKDVLEKRS